MSVIMTAAGEALKARLQAEGKPLVIDTFVFAHIPNLDPTEQLPPGSRFPRNRWCTPIRSRMSTGLT